ncbi:MAG: TolC family protein [Planctomycetes bacterium]|nr:TolC family protein [Planctomycetota bacterium]
MSYQRLFTIYQTIVVSLALCLALCSCQRYSALELNSTKIHKEIIQLRTERSENSNSTQPFTFTDAAKILEKHNRELQLLHQQYKASLELAKIKSPWPNPSIEFGPAFGGRLEDTVASSRQGFLSLAFQIPLGPRLSRNDDLKNILAQQSYTSKVIQHRTLYFKLKEAYLKYAFSAIKTKQVAELQKSLATFRRSLEKSIQAGLGTSLGLFDTNIRLTNLELEAKDLVIEQIKNSESLAQLLDVDLKYIRELNFSQPSSIFNFWSEANLLEIMTENNNQLAIDKMNFRKSDQVLKLELAKQYPDLSIGFSREQEVGEKTVITSIPLGIDIPLFDRNQSGISQAINQRKIHLRAYKNTLSELSTSLDSRIQLCKISLEQLDIIDKKLIPQYKQSMNEAQKAISFGSLDSLQYLDMRARYEEAHLKRIELQEKAWLNVILLENLCGYPLLNMNGQPNATTPNTFPN